MNYSTSHKVLADLQRLRDFLMTQNMYEKDQDINNMLSLYISTIDEYAVQTGTFNEPARKEKLEQFLSNMLNMDIPEGKLSSLLTEIREGMEGGKELSDLLRRISAGMPNLRL